MGKFSGVLIASDYDNTLVYTEDALKTLSAMPALLPENRQALEYFMAEGGIFSVATGRALPSFEDVCDTLPMNGPTILFNGAAIYDFSEQRYLYTAFLPESVRPCIAAVLAAWPDAAVEIYHDDNSIHALQPNEITEQHTHLTHAPTEFLTSIDQVPMPISKVLFEIAPEKQDALRRYIAATPWAAQFEQVVPSSSQLLELTAKGANKGDMVRKLAELLHIERRNVYCMGDHANDITMLQYAAVPFAPANAIDAVKQVEGIHILPDARCGTAAALVKELESLY